MEKDKIDGVVKFKQKHGTNFQIKGEKCLTTSLQLLLSQPRNVLLTVFCASPYTSFVQVPHLKFFSSQVIVHLITLIWPRSRKNTVCLS